MKTWRKLFFPFSPLYGLVVWMRNYFYDIGWFRSYRPQTPVLCVGNLSVGGTGKTPMVEWILRYYAERNRKVAVLSRGYGRKSVGYIEVQSGQDSAAVGDEPLQLKQKFPKACIAVDANRKRGIQILEETSGPEIIILDDGFQHRKVKATRSILLTSWDKLYRAQTYLPAGDLRDHKNQSKRADLIIVTKFSENPNVKVREETVRKLKPLAFQKIIFSTFAYENPKDSFGNEVTWEYLADQELTLVTGIANPISLLNYLDKRQIHYKHLEFPDHHAFSQADMMRIKKSGKVLTTEKDGVRLKGKLSDFYVIGVAHHFEPEDRKTFENFLDRI